MIQSISTKLGWSIRVTQLIDIILIFQLFLFRFQCLHFVLVSQSSVNNASIIQHTLYFLFFVFLPTLSVFMNFKLGKSKQKLTVMIVQKKM